MSLAPFGGFLMPPGWGTAAYTTEADNMGLFAGSMHHARFLYNALIDGSSRDTGNTGNTTVLRPHLVMAQVTATKKWKPFDNGADDGTEIPRGILTFLGINTQLNGADQDRFLATILIGGLVQPESICIASTAGWGLDQVTAAHVNVRKAFKYAIQFLDDPMAFVAEPYADRIA